MQNLELNKRLAELLGWTNVVDAGGALLGRPPGGAANSRDQAAVPNWAGDWAAAGPLGAEHEIDILHNWQSVYGRWGRGYSEHVHVAVVDDDRAAATCLALALAAIAKLEAYP